MVVVIYYKANIHNMTPCCTCIRLLPVCRASVRAWGTRLAKQGVINPDVVDWVVEPKVDGLAVRLVYR